MDLFMKVAWINQIKLMREWTIFNEQSLNIWFEYNLMEAIHEKFPVIW